MSIDRPGCTSAVDAKPVVSPFRVAVRFDRVNALARQEFGGLRSRALIGRILLSPLPNHVGSRLRVRVLRSIGFRGLDQSVVMWGLPTITGGGPICEHLIVGPHAMFNIGCLLNLGD